MDCRTLLAVLAAILLQKVTAANADTSCLPSPTEPLGPCDTVKLDCPLFASPAGAKVLVTRYAPPIDDAISKPFGAAVGRNIAEGMRLYFNNLRSDRLGLEAGLNSSELQVQYLGCIIRDHNNAREIGKKWGADLVVWGSTVQNIASPSGKMPKIVQTVNINQGAQVMGAVKPIINTPPPPQGGSWRTYLTAVKWADLEPKQCPSMSVRNLPVIQRMSFPQMVPKDSLALFEFVLAIYASHTGRHALAARYIDRFRKEFSGPEDNPEMLRIFGQSYMVSGRRAEGIQFLERAVTACGNNEPCLEESLGYRGWGYGFMHKDSLAMNDLHASLALARKLGDECHEPSLLVNLAEMHLRNNASKDIDKALTLLKSALEKSKQLSTSTSQAQVLATMGKAYFQQDNYMKAQESLHQSLNLLANEDESKAPIRSFALIELGNVYVQQGNLEQARHHFEDSVPYIKRTGDVYLLILAIQKLAHVYQLTKQETKAIALYKQADDLLVKIGDDSERASVVQNLGYLYQSLSDTARSKKYFEMAVKLIMQSKRPSEVAAMLHERGQTAELQGEPKMAKAFYLQALQFAESAKDDYYQSFILHSLAGVYFDLGEENSALLGFKKSLSLAQKIKNPHFEAWNWMMLGSLDNLHRRYNEALANFEKALIQNRLAGHKSGEAGILFLSGRTLISLGRFDEALSSLQLAKSIFEQQGERDQIIEVMGEIGHAYQRKRNLSKALEIYEQAVKIFKEGDDPFHYMEVCLTLTNVYFNQDRKLDALNLLSKSLSYVNKVRNPKNRVALLHRAGNLYGALAENEAALANLNQALDLYRSLGDVRSIKRCQADLGRIYLQRGEGAKAIPPLESAVKVAVEAGDAEEEGHLRNDLGRAYVAAGQFQAGLRELSRALTLAQQEQDITGQATVTLNRAETLQSMGDAMALNSYREAARLFVSAGDLSMSKHCWSRMASIAINFRNLAAGREALAKLSELGEPVAHLKAKEGQLLSCSGGDVSAASAAYQEVIVSAGKSQEMYLKGLAGLQRIQNRREWDGCPGLLITEVVANSPSATAGLRPGAILVRYNGQCVGRPEDLEALSRYLTPYQTVQLKLWSENKLLTLQHAGARLQASTVDF